MCVIDEAAPEMREISANIQISIENCVECGPRMEVKLEIWAKELYIVHHLP